MRTELMQEMQKLSDEQFAFLTTQLYFWSKIISTHTYIFSGNLSPEKLSIAADVIVNDALINEDPDIPKTLEKLITSLDIGDSEELAKLKPEDLEKFKQKTLAKLKAFLKAATINVFIWEAIVKKASAYSRATGDKEGHGEIVAKLQEAKAMRIEYLAEKAQKQKAMPKQEAAPKKTSKWEKAAKAPPAVEKAEKIAVDIESIKKDLFDWLNNKNYALDPNDLDRHKKYLLAILKLYPKADADSQALMKDAFEKTVAQHTYINQFLKVLGSIIDPLELKLFMELFPAEHMNLLWNNELDSFAGLSVREEQSRRLITLLGSLDKKQQEESFKVPNFWALIENQPEPAVEAFSPDQFKNIAMYLEAYDRARITSFANKVVSTIKQDEIDPEKMVNIFRALKPLAKLDSQMEGKLSAKKTNFKIKYKKDPRIDTWKQLLDQPL